MAAAKQEVWPQTDARFALLLISLASFKTGKGQGVQSELARWETMLLSLERGHAEKVRPKIRRALLLNIQPATLQPRLLEHLDRLVDYGQVREKVVSVVQMQRNQMPWTAIKSMARMTKGRKRG